MQYTEHVTPFLQLDTLRGSLEAARSDCRRLYHESELVVCNVNEWVSEQKEANKTSGEKILEQTKQIQQLSTEKDHLQEVIEQMQKENRYLRDLEDERRIENERCKWLLVVVNFQLSLRTSDLERHHPSGNTGSVRIARRAFTSGGNLRTKPRGGS
ncbi:unnamed protein product [Ranitomeya imitator]|uniref:Uncharacterized protein n=1 Tax=Ranitomeya imitator TaxID=111125 RepID=A0ABN9M109_9NEOB|nr:unnamed protein product [Ranitomeya imitator]